MLGRDDDRSGRNNVSMESVASDSAATEAGVPIPRHAGLVAPERALGLAATSAVGNRLLDRSSRCELLLEIGRSLPTAGSYAVNVKVIPDQLLLRYFSTANSVADLIDRRWEWW